MKLSMRIAGLCGSGTFLVSALPGFYHQVRPTDLSNMSSQALSGMAVVENLLISLGGALVVGTIGYIIGDILSNPKGSRKKKKKPADRAPARQLETVAAAPMGEESVDPTATSAALPGQPPLEEI